MTIHKSCFLEYLRTLLCVLSACTHQITYVDVLDMCDAADCQESTTVPETTFTTILVNQCSGDADCDDGLFCDGEEQCIDGTCVTDVTPCNGITLICDENLDACVCQKDSDCDNGAFCDGKEICNRGACQLSNLPCSSALPICDESLDLCMQCLIDSDCQIGTCKDGLCEATSCGNGLKDGVEQCDTNDLNGMSCTSLGFGVGVLTCTPSCTYDTNSCSTPLCFSDNFSDNVLTGWTKLAGIDMQKTGGTLRTLVDENTDTHYKITTGDGWTNYVYTVDHQSVDNDVTGFTVRIQDKDNYYLVTQGFGDNDGWWLRFLKIVNDSPTPLASAVYNYGDGPGQVNSETTWYQFKVEANGATLKVYIDGILKFNVTDNTFTNGSAGIWFDNQKNAELDNVSIGCLQ